MKSRSILSVWNILLVFVVIIQGIACNSKVNHEVEEVEVFEKSVFKELEQLDFIIKNNNNENEIVHKHSILSGQLNDIIEIDNNNLLELKVVVPNKLKDVSYRFNLILKSLDTENQNNVSQSYPLTIFKKQEQNIKTKKVVELKSIIDFNSDVATRNLIYRNSVNYQLYLFGYKIKQDNKDKIIISNKDSKYLGTIKLNLKPISYHNNDFEEFFYLNHIDHKFQSSSPQPKKTLSLIFTAFLSIIWIPLLIQLKNLKLNFNNINIKSIAFLGLLLSYGNLLFVYWLKLTIFEFLKYSAILLCLLFTVLISSLSSRQSISNDLL